VAGDHAPPGRTPLSGTEPVSQTSSVEIRAAQVEAACAAEHLAAGAFQARRAVRATHGVVGGGVAVPLGRLAQSSGSFRLPGLYPGLHRLRDSCCGLVHDAQVKRNCPAALVIAK
jgi:hypothetical protein